MPRRIKPENPENTPQSPAPGTPEFLALIERHKDFVEQQTGIRPRFILDIGVGDMPGYGEPEPTRKRRR
ncbi:MAG: hypothetical protein Q8K55_01365 [Gemmatimonadaceae bacterium]|nr:hypothetical protein [Gemmatimonadaceae bacterium]